MNYHHPSSLLSPPDGVVVVNMEDEARPPASQSSFAQQHQPPLPLLPPHSLQTTYALSHNNNPNTMDQVHQYYYQPSVDDTIYNNNNNNIDDGDDTPYSDTEEEYVDIPTARRNQQQPSLYYNSNSNNSDRHSEYDNHTVLTAANITHNALGYDTIYGSNNNSNSNSNTDATTVVHEMYLTLLYMMSHPTEFEKCILAVSSSSSHHRHMTTTTGTGDDTVSLGTETTDVSVTPPRPLPISSSSHHPITTTTTTTTNTTTSNNNSTFTSIIEEGISNLILTRKPKSKSNHSEPLNRTNTGNGTSTQYYDDEDEDIDNTINNGVLLPYLIFCDDAEIVLPQAHTASQLFGIELITGIELEAASGMIPICQLFLRWLAIMPNGDHLEILDPPGLTVMRIAGGRYRVTAAHRVVWTWMNEFVPLQYNHTMSSGGGGSSNGSHPTHTTTTSGMTSVDPIPVTKPNSRGNNTKNSSHINNNNTQTLQMGDLVGMTIVDVFESDHSGKLLSYCPTFDNRNIYKIDRTTYQIQKHTTKAMKRVVQKVQQTSHLAKIMTQYTSQFATQVHQRVTHAVQSYHPPPKTEHVGQRSIWNHHPAVLLDDPPNHDYSPNVVVVGNGNTNQSAHQGDEEVEQEKVALSLSPHRTLSKITSESTSVYHGDDDNERHEV